MEGNLLLDLPVVTGASDAKEHLVDHLEDHPVAQENQIHSREMSKGAFIVDRWIILEAIIHVLEERAALTLLRFLNSTMVYR